MPQYQAPVEDWLFILNDLLRVQDQAWPGYADLTPDFCGDVLREAARFHEEVVFPVGMKGDAQGATLVDGAVQTPAGYRELWAAYRESGWLRLSLPEGIGGAGLPQILSNIVGEMRSATAHSFGMYVNFCPSAARMLHALGDEWIRRLVVPRLASGEWTATMCLTESHCGTDLRQIRTRAVERADGSWTLDGTKIFISGGDHDLGGNVIHIVLAKVRNKDGTLPDGLSGVNVFLVSKLALDPGTGLAEGSNGVTVSSIEHKMGIEGNATCVMNFEGARAWRISDATAKGMAANMAAMFLLMNYARVGTAMSGVGYAEIAGQNARAYARGRLSGRAATGPRHPGLPADPLVVHADIRRLLMDTRAFAEGGRATALRAAMWQAEAEATSDPARRLAATDLMEVMTPVMKAYFTDKGFEAANDSLQVFGGHGYIREYGMEQMVRNARIGQIYEGANGIQAIDLVQRKLPANQWRAADTLLSEMAAFIEQSDEIPGMRQYTDPLRSARLQLESIFTTIRNRSAAQLELNLSAAYDVLQACGIAVVAWTWAATAAVLLMEDRWPAGMKRSKLALARHWMERELPKLLTLGARVSTDAPAALELADDEI